MTELAKARSSLLAVVNWISQLNAKRENLISEVGVNLFCQFCVIMDVKCSFSSLVGGSCSYDPRDRSRSTEVIPFLNCKRDIAGHKSSLSITDVETEIELILGRVSTSFSSELDLSELTICPRHRSSLGIGWRRGSNLCRVPPPISKHGGQAQKNAKAERGRDQVPESPAREDFQHAKKIIIKNAIANDIIDVIRQDLSANFSKSVCANVSKLLR